MKSIRTRLITYFAVILAAVCAILGYAAYNRAADGVFFRRIDCHKPAGVNVR